MSERGSFVTQFCYCNKCFEILKKHLLHKNTHLWSNVINGCDIEIPIIAGKIRSTYPDGEIYYMHEIIRDIESEGKLCDDVTIAVICDSGKTKIFRVKCKRKKKEKKDDN